MSMPRLARENCTIAAQRIPGYVGVSGMITARLPHWQGLGSSQISDEPPTWGSKSGSTGGVVQSRHPTAVWHMTVCHCGGSP